MKELSLTWTGLGPYLKSTPRHWFFRTTGPVLSVPPTTLELLPILTLPDRPRTMPENHEVLVEEEEDEDDTVDKEAEEVWERFISTALIRPPPSWDCVFCFLKLLLDSQRLKNVIYVRKKKGFIRSRAVVVVLLLSVAPLTWIDMHGGLILHALTCSLFFFFYAALTCT